MNAPLSPRRPPQNTPLLALVVLGGLAFAAWLNAHLGDFTAERGWRAVLQVAALAMAFGAMLHLVVTAIARVAVGLQDDIDALAAMRKPAHKPHQGPEDAA